MQQRIDEMQLFGTFHFLACVIIICVLFVYAYICVLFVCMYTNIVYVHIYTYCLCMCVYIYITYIYLLLFLLKFMLFNGSAFKKTGRYSINTYLLV